MNKLLLLSMEFIVSKININNKLSQPDWLKKGGHLPREATCTICTWTLHVHIICTSDRWSSISRHRIKLGYNLPTGTCIIISACTCVCLQLDTSNFLVIMLICACLEKWGRWFWKWSKLHMNDFKTSWVLCFCQSVRQHCVVNVQPVGRKLVGSVVPDECGMLHTFISWMGRWKPDCILPG